MSIPSLGVAFLFSLFFFSFSAQGSQHGSEIYKPITFYNAFRIYRENNVQTKLASPIPSPTVATSIGTRFLLVISPSGSALLLLLVSFSRRSEKERLED